MRPLYLNVQAFGSYGSLTKIDFTLPDQNLFLIAGDTGAGKSTIFDALVFALYGEASSGNNKKDGAELQSQFADYALLPFAELTFTEREGGEEHIYTVRRTPRHVRPVRRGSGLTEEKETVMLLLPDGTQFPANTRETNAKIEEIVGLTKEQFMQVAMIAQGEFMELLRARSDEKKVIFRKLFHTGIFQQLLLELGKRRKDKAGELEQIRTACQTETAHIRVPDTFERAGELLDLKRSILGSEQLSVTDMEAMLDLLRQLCALLGRQMAQAQEAYEQSSLLRDRARDAYTSAEHLLPLFEQRDRAQAQLEECVREKPKMRQTELLLARIGQAWELRGIWQRTWDAQQTVRETQEALRSGAEAVPQLQAECARTERAEAEAAKERESALAEHTRIQEQAERAFEAFERAGKAEEEAQETAKKAQRSRETAGEAQQSLSELERQEAAWREEAKGLAQTRQQLERWKMEKEQADLALRQLDLLKESRKEQEAAVREAQRSQAAYERARAVRSEESAALIRMQNSFLDAQAGYLAREKLRAGEPCPVCGSVDHPSPAVLAREDQKLTREEIDRLRERVAQLTAAQEQASAAAGEAAQERERAVSRYRSRMETLLGQLGAVFAAGPDLEQEEAEKLLSGWCSRLRGEGNILEKQAQKLDYLESALSGAEGKRAQLAAQAAQAAAALSETEALLAGALAVFEKLKEEAGRVYPTREEAKKALLAAEGGLRERDRRFLEAKEAAALAKGRLERTRAVIERCRQVLPAQQQEQANRRGSYDAACAETGLSQPEWEELTERYDKRSAEQLQKSLDEYGMREAAARSAGRAAGEAIAGRERPDLPRLRQEKEEAEEAWTRSAAQLSLVREYEGACRGAFEALAPKMQKRRAVMEEYTRLDSLYNRFAGKVSGARMDIETFVQRYYLEQILGAANARFREMSAGQFELRMCGIGRAGEGRNKGLDLMVYSEVTGKEREVRTLSGGESFMAALSLALGMADQIQAGASSIHLDVMFIDEGFGSLDEHSRDQAVRVLKRMAGGSRLIGIISHVSELRQEIEDQLLVSKDDTGSHVRWQLS